MNLSRELQIGKAGEHIACADLILQGFNAFLTDQGLPYDLIVQTPRGISRVQVKATLKTVTYGRSNEVYRFGLRRGKGSYDRIADVEVDYFAFVALDLKMVAYLRPIQLQSRQEPGIAMLIEFQTRRPGKGKFLEDYARFPL